MSKVRNRKMKNIVVTPIENRENSFSFNHKGEEIKVDKMKFALYSDVFRENIFHLDTNFVDLNDILSKDAVKELVTLINTDQYEFKKETSLDLLVLIDDWHINAIQAELISFINENIELEELITYANKIPIGIDIHSILDLISQRLDAAISNPIFSNLALEKIIATVLSKEVIYRDHNLLFNFIMDMLDKYHYEAYPLISAIDIIRLSPSQAEKLFSRPEFATPAESVKTDIQRINEKILQLNNSMESLQGNHNSLQILNDRFKIVQKNLEDISNAIEVNEEKSFEKIEDLKERSNTVQRRFKNDARRMKTDFKVITSKIKSYETKMANDFPEDS